MKLKYEDFGECKICGNIITRSQIDCVMVLDNPDGTYMHGWYCQDDSPGHIPGEKESKACAALFDRWVERMLE